VTAYYNPADYRRRRANYTHFRRHLGLPVLAVELSFDGRFQLTDDDADILVRLHGGDVMWQKERLLNIALDALPAACTRVAWIDCDLIFEAPDWADRTARLLDRFPLVQLFAESHTMAPDWLPGDHAPPGVRIYPSATSQVARGESLHDCFVEWPPGFLAMSGYAWAGRRDIIARHRFYDACIIGAGDQALAAVAHGCPEGAVRRQRMNEAFLRHFEAWAGPFREAIRGNVAFLDDRILHLWHGTVENRGYYSRHEGLARFGFDPAADLIADASGAWRWASDKPEMHGFLRDYFFARREDD
jgi:hypothetical protein